jgi:hypothetical protein
VTQNFSAAMGEGRMRHGGDPVLEWCFGNVIGKADCYRLDDDRCSGFPGRLVTVRIGDSAG